MDEVHNVGIQKDNGAWEIETEVVVVGGGGCGMAATLASAQGGAETVLLEKQHRPLSNTARSGAMIPAAENIVMSGCIAFPVTRTALARGEEQLRIACLGGACASAGTAGGHVAGSGADPPTRLA